MDEGLDEAIRNGRKDCRIASREYGPGVRGEHTRSAVVVDRVGAVDHRTDHCRGRAIRRDDAWIARVQEGGNLENGADESEHRPGEHYPN